ncbi:MAG: penicillin-binding protein activator [Deltaproteobacteria bacterium]|jgi:branched-chain amino acid transport system substrate-binding protein|nr:penicillin-binding protein activator [Deltaproteobacteria bacterium]
MTKKQWTYIVLAVIAVAIIALSCEKKPPIHGDIIIGSTLPLSGDAAVWGKNTQEGIDLALEEINAAGGVLSRKLVVVYEDTRALPKEGVTAYHKLTTVDKVKVIIDDSVSSVTLAMAPLAQNDHVVVIATGATAPKISEAGEYIFRVWNSDAYEGEVSAGYAFDTLGLRSVAILYINNEYGKGLEQVFKHRFEECGGSISISESFAQSTTDIRTQLTKIQASNPDGLYVVGYPKEIPIALKQAKELGLNLALIGTVAMQDPQLIQTAGDAAEGLMFPYPKDSSGQYVTLFKEAFQKKYGKEPGITSDVGYDAAKMIAKAMELLGGTSGEDIRKGLNMLKDYPGVSGTMTFDANGDVHKPMGIKIVKGGSFQWHK